MKPTEYENAVVIETVAEQLWQADSLRATGRKRQVPWREAPEQDHAKFRDFASIAVKVVNAYEAKPDTSAWQPIATHPKKPNKLFEIWHYGAMFPVVVEWVPHYKAFVTRDRPRAEILPYPKGSATHWRALSTPPQTE